MRIPVFLAMPAQEPLIESALAFRERRAPAFPLSYATLPKERDFVLDIDFAAVPLGTGDTTESVRAAVDQPAESELFGVHGSIEVESLEDVPVTIGQRSVFADPQIQPFLTCGGSPPVGSVMHVQTKLAVAALAAKGLDGKDVAVAIMDSGINLDHLKKKLGAMPAFDFSNSWTPPGLTTLPGKHPVDHGTMCAYDVLIAAPKATLLDFPILAGSTPGGNIVGKHLNAAWSGFTHLINSWAVSFAPGSVSKYKALVVSNSWGVYHPSWDFPAGHPGRYCDNPAHLFNLMISTFASTGADILFAAGNCGAQCADIRCQSRTKGTIMGANAHPEVLTLAGCDTQDARVGYSSQGPSIAGMHPPKPDLTCYTHFLGSEAFGSGSADVGTSTACPVAAGCVAALRTKVSPSSTPPANLFAQLRATARPAGGQTSWNGDYGHGILDPLAAASSLGL